MKRSKEPLPNTELDISISSPPDGAKKNLNINAKYGPTNILCDMTVWPGSQGGDGVVLLSGGRPQV